MRCTKMPGVWIWSGSSAPIGTFDPDNIHTPGVFVQRILQGARYVKQIENRTVRKRAAS